MKKSLLALLLPLLLFVSCSSMPEKVSESDTLLLIPIDFERDNEGSIFGYYSAIIEDTDGSPVAIAKLTPSKDFQYVSGLTEGNYTITSVFFTYTQGGKKGSYSEVNIPFELSPGKLSVLQQYMKYEYFKENPLDNTYYMRGQFVPMNASVKENISTIASENEVMQTWDMEYLGK